MSYVSVTVVPVCPLPLARMRHHSHQTQGKEVVVVSKRKKSLVTTRNCKITVSNFRYFSHRLGSS